MIDGSIKILVCLLIIYDVLSIPEETGGGGIGHVQYTNFLLLHEELPQICTLTQCTLISSQFLWVWSLGTAYLGSLLRVLQGCSQSDS